MNLTNKCKSHTDVSNRLVYHKQLYITARHTSHTSVCYNQVYIKIGVHYNQVYRVYHKQMYITDSCATYTGIYYSHVDIIHRCTLQPGVNHIQVYIIARCTLYIGVRYKQVNMSTYQDDITESFTLQRNQ